MKIAFRIALLFAPVVLFVTCTAILPNGEFQPSGAQFYVKSSIQVKKIAGATANFDLTAPYAGDLTATSLSSSSESDVLPAGLILKSSSSLIQHMILVRDYPITVPAGHDTIITIGYYCCNQQRTFPTGQDTLSIGPVTDNADLQRIVEITKTKQLGSSNISYVQDVVTYVTNGEVLRQASIDSLNALPPG